MTDNAPVSSVAIMGGGIAGLSAAYTLAKANIPVCVYEASDRWGGRIWTSRASTGTLFIERGAELVDSNHAQLIALAKELGVGLAAVEEATTTGQIHVYHQGTLHSMDSLKDMMINPSTVLIPSAKTIDGMSLEQFLEDIFQNMPAMGKHMLKNAFVSELGLDAGEMSAENLPALWEISRGNNIFPEPFSLYGHSDEGHRIAGGSSALIDALVERLKTLPHVRLYTGKVIAGADMDDKGVTLSFKDGTQAHHHEAICTIPFPLLQRMEGFLPKERSAETAYPQEHIRLGRHAKVCLPMIGKPWETMAETYPGFNGKLVMTDGPLQYCWVTSYDPASNRSMVTVLIGGSMAAEPADALVSQCKKALATVYNRTEEALFPPHQAIVRNQEAYDPASDAPYVVQWQDMPYAGGSYSTPAVGQLERLEQSLAFVSKQGCIYFAGEHMSAQHFGFMEGAIQTATAAAHSLQQQRSTVPDNHLQNTANDLTKHAFMQGMLR